MLSIAVEYRMRVNDELTLVYTVSIHQESMSG